MNCLSRCCKGLPVFIFKLGFMKCISVKVSDLWPLSGGAVEESCWPGGGAVWDATQQPGKCFQCAPSWLAFTTKTVWREFPFLECLWDLKNEMTWSKQLSQVKIYSSVGATLLKNLFKPVLFWRSWSWSALQTWLRRSTPFLEDNTSCRRSEASPTAWWELTPSAHSSPSTSLRPRREIRVSTGTTLPIMHHTQWCFLPDAKWSQCLQVFCL